MRSNKKNWYVPPATHSRLAVQLDPRRGPVLNQHTDRRYTRIMAELHKLIHYLSRQSRTDVLLTDLRAAHGLMARAQTYYQVTFLGGNIQWRV